MTHHDTRKYKPEPDPNAERCQCVTDHYTRIDGDIPQCGMSRWQPHSNLYCQGCEQLHGDIWKNRILEGGQ